MGLRSHTAIWASITVLAFFYLGYILFGQEPARIVANSLVIGVATAIFLNWSRRAVYHIRQGMRDGTSNIIVGTWGIWTVILLYFLYTQVFIFMGRPQWLIDLPIGLTFSSLFFLTGSYTFLAPVNTQEEIERDSLVWWFSAVAVGCLVAGALMTLAFLRIMQYA